MHSSSLASATDRPRTADGDLLPVSAQAGENWPQTDHRTLEQLRNGTTAEKEAALQQLFIAYLQPLSQYIRRHWPLLSAWDVDDLAADFITRCLIGEKAHFLAYEPDRSGTPVRLRTYLRAILDNYLRNHRRNTRAQSRGGKLQFEALDPVRPAAHQELNAAGVTSAPGVDIEAYDRHWAQHILNISFLALEQGTPTTREWLPILRPWILADPGDSSLKEIARENGSTHVAIRAHLYRLRKAWRQAVRNAVAQTVSHPDDIDDELRHLAAVLSRHYAL